MRPTRPRLDSSLYVGCQRYFLTFCSHNREEHFTNATIVDLVLQQFLTAATKFAMAIVAYCFMPDHVHLLVEGERADADLKTFVHAAKQKAGFEFSQRTAARLWQPSYYDRVLRDEEQTVSVVRYIVENPVRKRLVTSPDEYAFLGSSRYAMNEIVDAASWQP